MDQGRTFLAIGLSFLIFLVWNIFFVDKEPRRQEVETAPTQATQTAPPTEIAQNQSQKPAETSIPSTTPSIPMKPDTAIRTLSVETRLYNLSLSEEKAVVKQFALKKFREEVETDSPMKQLISGENPLGSVQFGFEGKTLEGIDSAVFKADAPPDKIVVTDAERSVVFSWRSPRGITVEKRYTFFPNSYLIGLTVTLRNESDDLFQDKPSLILFRDLRKSSGSKFGFEGPSAMVDSSVEKIEVKKIKDKPIPPGSVKWWAIEDRYFMTAAVPPTLDGGQVAFFTQNSGIIEARFIHPAVTLEPRTQQHFEYHLYFGPKNTKILSDSGHNLKEAIDFGLFDFIAKPCVWLMNQIYRVVPNYGIAIIVLTLLSKILLWPLGNKSYKSMSEMKKLQPLMTEIREKFKNDKKKQQQEIMNLYRTYKINPLGGCLPMVAQIPVFFALYRMLYEAIELRHAPFFGWITDLSAPDRLFRFDFSIPFMQPPYGIPVLTLIMGATMLLQQKMSPPPGDPGQAKMMMLMPIVFTFIFINFSSGLVLYWLVNNVLSIGQQYYVSKKTA